MDSVELEGHEKSELQINSHPRSLSGWLALPSQHVPRPLSSIVLSCIQFEEEEQKASLNYTDK